MRTSFLLLLGGLFAATAHAQTRISIGPRLGGNLATGTFSTIDPAAAAGYNYDYSRSALLGGQVGVAASIGSGHWAVQPALVFTQKGLRQKLTGSYSFGGVSVQENDQIDCRVHYLELPVNVVYSLGADGNGFQLFAGPYVAIGVGGRATYTLNYTTNDPNFPGGSDSESQPFAFGNTFAEPDPNSTNSVDADARARRFDAGINAGIGYRRGPLQVQLGYGLGLLNVQPDYPASYQMSNDKGYLRATQLTATYFFPTSRK
ncbi:MAG: PorT family protein [Hymenobacter sp.]|nr:MAG: PorT family protein [Hymenobacter sp.]